VLQNKKYEVRGWWLTIIQQRYKQSNVWET
jgi:hypothetical protein